MVKKMSLIVFFVLYIVLVHSSSVNVEGLKMFDFGRIAREAEKFVKEEVAPRVVEAVDELKKPENVQKLVKTVSDVAEEAKKKADSRDVAGVKSELLMVIGASVESAVHKIAAQPIIQKAVKEVEENNEVKEVVQKIRDGVQEIQKPETQKKIAEEASKFVQNPEERIQQLTRQHPNQAREVSNAAHDAIREARNAIHSNPEVNRAANAVAGELDVGTHIDHDYYYYDDYHYLDYRNYELERENSELRRRVAELRDGGDNVMEIGAEGDKVAEDGEAVCCMCMTNEPNRVCLPCGHISACGECLEQYKESNHGHLNCPVCRTEVNCVHKVFPTQN